MINYLKNIPDSAKDFGLCKLLAVRQESIHLKHIFTEVFDRKSIGIEEMLSKLGMSVIDYMKIMTNKFRVIYHLDRNFDCEISELLKQGKNNNFFDQLNLFSRLNNLVVLDFDGVCTDYYFQQNFFPKIKKVPIVVCSANPKIHHSYLEHKGFNISATYSCKGKWDKIRKLIQLSTGRDNVFFIDNEEEYLKYARIFGIKTYLYDSEKKNEHKLRYFTLKTNPENV